MCRCVWWQEDSQSQCYNFRWLHFKYPIVRKSKDFNGNICSQYSKNEDKIHKKLQIINCIIKEFTWWLRYIKDVPKSIPKIENIFRLFHWKCLGTALQRSRQPELEGTQHCSGLWQIDFKTRFHLMVPFLIKTWFSIRQNNTSVSASLNHPINKLLVDLVGADVQTQTQPLMWWGSFKLVLWISTPQNKIHLKDFLW